MSSRSVDGVVALGNIVNFASRDGLRLLKELARVTKPRGTLLADFATRVGAIQEFFHQAARHRLLPKILRRRRYYLVDEVLVSGIQPFDPRRLSPWEFKFYTAEEATRDLGKAGFEVVDLMSVGPVARMDDRLISVARRDRRTWQSLLEVEERVGRRPGVRETGDGFLVCAVRRRP
jgi:ubiquinone/menaquinone biosynthesis C-methylase UbiE